MPTYSYECRKCGNVQDVFHAISAKPRVKCEACGGSCKKLFGTGSGLIFKGSGFYETDYKNKGGAPKSGDGKGDAAKSESGTSESGKGESKGGEGTSSGSKSGGTSSSSGETKKSSAGAKNGS